MINSENYLVRCKIKDWVFDSQDYGETWVECYIAPISISHKGTQFGIYIEALKKLAYLCGSGEFEGTPVVKDYLLPETIGRFTGLLDKNGKKIFEGDIVRSDWGYSGVVDYEDFIYAKCECTISDNIEVIGNIHDVSEF